MKNMLLAALLLLATFGLQAQTTLYIRNNTACPVNVRAFTDGKNPCTPASYCGSSLYTAGAFSVTMLTPINIGCTGGWAYAAFNTNPNPNGWPDGCLVGYVLDPHYPPYICNFTPTGSFYVVSCGSFVNVT